MWPGLTSQRWLGNRLWRALLKSGGSLQALASRSRLVEVKLPPVIYVVNTSGNVFLISTWLPTEAQSKGGMSVGRVGSLQRDYRVFYGRPEIRLE